MTPLHPSNRSFGRSCTGVFAALGIYSLCTDGVLFPLWFALSVSAAFLTVFRPDALEEPKLAWMTVWQRFRVEVWPVIVRALFLGVLVPVGHVMKRVSQSRLRRR